jgi:hypothetical protein
MFGLGWIARFSTEAGLPMRKHSSGSLSPLLQLTVTLAVIALCVSCASLARLGGFEDETPEPAVAAEKQAPVTERHEPVPQPAAATDAPVDEGQERVVRFLLARDQDERLLRAEELCREQQRFVDRPADDPTERAALSWLADFLDPQDERARARTQLGPRSGLRDVHHEPGFEIFVEAGGGLLLFDREGVLIGRIGRENRSLADIGFHDIDGDRQQEIFVAYDSGTNSGNRFTEVVGYKEVGGVLREVLERRLYETADRWVPSGLGPRLSTVVLAGETYVVLSQGSDAEFLRWDAAQSRLVVESRPAHRAFLD